MNIGNRVIFNVNDNIWKGMIGTITGVTDDGDYEVRMDGMKSNPSFKENELTLFKPEYDWRYGDNGVQEYYDTTINGRYLLVFRNKADKNLDHWMCSIDNAMIQNKTRNDYYKNKKDMLPTQRPICLLGGRPAYLIKKTEWCFNHNITEISA